MVKKSENVHRRDHVIETTFNKRKIWEQNREQKMKQKMS